MSGVSAMPGLPIWEGEVMEESDEVAQTISQKPVLNRMEDQIVDVLCSPLPGGHREAVHTSGARAEPDGEAERGRASVPSSGGANHQSCACRSTGARAELHGDADRGHARSPVPAVLHHSEALPHVETSEPPSSSLVDFKPAMARSPVPGNC